MLSLERQRKILELLNHNSEVRVSELSEILGVSAATVRRDLERLEEQGLALRTHGGAVLSELTPSDPPIFERFSVNVEEKRQIGQAAAALIEEGETVFLGTGSTILEVAHHLRGRKNITVITNALTVINALAQEPDITLISCGGLLNAGDYAFIGHLTEISLRELHPQKVFMGVQAITSTAGLTSDYLPEISTDRVIIQSAPELILVADHSKFAKVCTAVVAPIAAVHAIVTDSKTPPETIVYFRELGIRMVVAP